MSRSSRYLAAAVVAVMAAIVAASSASAAPAKKRCHVVVKKVHGHKRHVRVCKKSKPKPGKMLPALVPNPLNVAVHADTAHAVTATITADGGTLRMTGADGTEYTLTIPAKALLRSETVTMTPTASLGNLPAGVDLLGGVDLAPEALRLFEPATLTVKLAHPSQAKIQVASGYSKNGQDFHLVATARNGATFTIPILHFSGKTVEAIAELKDLLAIEGRLPADLEAQVEQFTAALELEQAHPDEAPPAGSPTHSQYLRAVYEKGLLPLLERATTDASLLPRAIHAYLSFARSLALLGVDDPISASENEHMRELLRKALEHALEQWSTECRTKHHFTILRFFSLEREAELGFVTDLPDATSAIASCLHFELDLDSVVDFVDDPFTEKTHVQIHGLKIDHLELLEQNKKVGLYITADVPVQASWYAPWTISDPADCLSDTGPVTPGGTFHVQLQLQFDTDIQIEENVPFYSDPFTFPSLIELQFFWKDTDTSTKRVLMGCPPPNGGGPSPEDMPDPWPVVYGLLYFTPDDPNPGTIDVWHLVDPANWVVQAKFNRQGDLGGQPYGENTTWTLRHTPG